MALLLLFFGLGGASLITQAILVRELLLVVFGTELCLGFLFASWLFWIGCGAVAGTRLAARVARPRTQLFWWVAIGALLPIAQIELVRHAHRWLDVPVGLVVSWQQALLLALAAAAPFCFMIGATFPLGCRLLEDRSGRGVGTLYTAEAVGAVVGGLIFAHVLVGRVGHYAIVDVAAAIVVALAARLLAGSGRALGLGVSAVLLFAAPLVGQWDAGSQRRELARMMPGQNVEAVFETAYEQVAIGRMEEQFTVYGDGVATATVPDPYETPAVVYNLLGQAPDPKNVLVFGNPATGLAGEIVRVLDGRNDRAPAAVTFVYPDERQVRALAARLPAEATRALGSRVRVVIDDPRAFVRSTREAFDLVFVDAPDPTAAYVNRLYTAEFFADAARVMTPSGVLGFRLTSASAYVGREMSELAVSVRKALGTAFANVAMTPGETGFFFASRSGEGITRDPGLIDARLRAWPGAAAHRAAIVLGYEPDRQRRLHEMMSAGAGAITNSDHHPVSYYYGSVLWDRFSSEKPSGESWLTRGLVAARSVGRGGVIGAVGLICAAWLLTRRLVRRRAAAIDTAVAVLVAGFAAMTTNLVLLIEYQSACGALYQRLAVMSALFMLGIAIGTNMAGRLAPSLERPAGFGAWILIGTALFALLLSGLLRVVDLWQPTGRQIAFAVFFCSAGTCLGAVFPTCAEALIRGSSDRGDRVAARAGGAMDAMDHLGAAVGALVTGTVILPAIGAFATLHSVALLAAATGCTWLVVARRA
jgi:predicted membrane-bound spermidine synthase